MIKYFPQMINLTFQRVSHQCLIGVMVITACSGSAIAQPPTGNFTKTLLNRQNSINSGSERKENLPPEPIPLRSVLRWKPEADERGWKYVVIHHSATSQGSVASINQSHLQRLDGDGRPWRGIAYHFVIGNGNGMQDGEIQATFRWEEQLEGAHAGDQLYNQQGIGICLIGDFEKSRPTEAQLRAVQELTSYLRREYKIPVSQVVGHSRVKATNCPGKHFPFERVVQDTEIETRAAVRTSNSKLSHEDAPVPQKNKVR